MIFWKWTFGGATFLFLFSAWVTHAEGASLSYALTCGAIVVAGVIAFLGGLFLLIFLPFMLSHWLIKIIQPRGANCDFLFQAVILRIYVIYEHFKGK